MKLLLNDESQRGQHRDAAVRELGLAVLEDGVLVCSDEVAGWIPCTTIVVAAGEAKSCLPRVGLTLCPQPSTKYTSVQ